MRRIASADLAPPGSLIRPVNPQDPSRDVTVRFPDGSGWHIDGRATYGDLPWSTSSVGWPWVHIDSRFDGECIVLAELLTKSECMTLTRTHPRDVPAWLMDRSKPEWIIGVGVFITHRVDDGPARVLMAKRLAGASDGQGSWSAPGGRLEASDVDIIACARREALEETGLVLGADCVVMPDHTHGHRPDGTPYLCVYVRATAEPSSKLDADGWPVTQQPEPDKHGPWQWFTADDLVRLRDAGAPAPDAVWSFDDAIAALHAADARRRYVVVVFENDEADRWQTFASLELAETACLGVSLVDNDSISAYVWDLERDELMEDDLDYDPTEKWYASKIASAKERLADLRAAYRGKMAPL